MSDNNFKQIKINLSKHSYHQITWKQPFYQLISHTHIVTQITLLTNLEWMKQLILSLSLSLSNTIPHKTACENESSWFIGGWGSYNIYIHKKNTINQKERKKKKVVVIVVECYNCKHTPRDTGTFTPALHNKVRVSLHKMIKATAWKPSSVK